MWMHHTANTYPFPFIYFERIRFTCKRHIKYGLRTASKNRIKKMARKNKYDLMQKAKENHILVLEPVSTRQERAILWILLEMPQCLNVYGTVISGCHCYYMWDDAISLAAHIHTQTKYQRAYTPHIDLIVYAHPK